MCSASRYSLLTARAHGMRCAATDSEEVLWRALRASQLGMRFRRQVVLLDRFIVDFFAPAARLVVEVDGPYHARRRAADARRERALERSGYRMLRVEAEQVRSGLLSVLALIEISLSGLKGVSSVT